MWLGLITRFWKPIAGAVLLIGAAWLLHHRGYESGYAASEAKWHPLFEAAERELAAANARTETKEAASRALSEQTEKTHAESMASLTLRAAAADRRIRDLSVRLATAPSRCEVPPASGTPAEPDAAAESIQRAAETGGSIAATGADCEADAAALAEWQKFYSGLQRINNQ